MKKLLLLLFLGALFRANAQYVPYTAQPFQLASAFNPAFSGVDNFSDLKLSYRYQWTGFGADAPSFINLAFNMRLKQPLDLSSNSLRIGNASLLYPEKLPRGKRIIHGFGGSFFNERVGQINRIGGGVNYAFNYPLSKKTRIAIGTSVMIDNTKIDLNKFELRDPVNDTFYNSLLDKGATQTNLNVRAGILLYAPKFYVGMSYYPLLNSVIQDAGVSSNDVFYQGSVQGGIAFPLAANASIRPSVLALWQMDNSFSIDYSVKAFLQDKAWFGFTYRDIQSGIGLFGININDSISFSYSYEMSLGDKSQFTDGSHDVVLSFRFNNFKRLGQYAW